MLETETRRRRGRPKPRYRIEARGAVPRGRCGATLARRKQKRAPGHVRTSVVATYQGDGTPTVGDGLGAASARQGKLGEP